MAGLETRPVQVFGCHVLLLHSASAKESRRDSGKFEFVGLAKTLFAAEKLDAFDDGSGLK